MKFYNFSFCVVQKDIQECRGMGVTDAIGNNTYLLFPGLYLASYESESPENQTEKDRWKSLRYLSFYPFISKIPPNSCSDTKACEVQVFKLWPLREVSSI